MRLNVEPSDRQVQPVAVGIDPGSKKEAFSVKSEAHTFLNVQTDAVTHVKKAVEVRRNMRRARRFRRWRRPARNKNRLSNCRRLPPSTKARWQWKLRLCRWLAKLFPVSRFVVEDIKAESRKGARRWNGSFSPLEVGKRWFYQELARIAPIETPEGWQTAEWRASLGLKKSSDKLSGKFEAHCVDSWVLANSWTGGHEAPENRRILFVTPLRLHRRQLHRLEPGKGGVRSRYGGTRSLGFKRGSLVKHPKHGVCYVGGTMGDRISLHCLKTGRRLSQNAKPEECRFRCYNSVRFR